MPNRNKKGRGTTQKKSSLMGVNFSRTPKLDMSKTLNSKDLDGVVEYIKTKQPKKIVFCVGAGISTNSGIPDFRTPGTGLYSNLAALKLPYPEAVFSLQYFRQDPQPFYTLAETLFPGAFKPTLTHTFIRLMQDKGLLLKCFTQNIDTLERMAGVNPEFIVEAHGSFATSRCIDCHKAEEIREKINQKEIPHCPHCDGLVKPDIVFFGEALPEEFWSSRYDMHAADLVFVIGTSLQVYPFASLPSYTLPSVPRILFNIDPVDQFFRMNDASILGDCDESIWTLSQKLGWDDELRKLHDEIDGIEREWNMEYVAGGDEGKKKAEEETVEALARELAEELKLDKEEDAELQRLEKAEGDDPKEESSKGEYSKPVELKEDEARGDKVGDASSTTEDAKGKL